VEDSNQASEVIRKSTEIDRAQIRALLDQAFHPSQYESRLCELVTLSDNYFEWVVEQESRIIGCILYSPATNGSTRIGFHLAPVAVHVDFQGQGIGTRLIRETLALAPVRNESVFVLGDPNYYERFGFKKTTQAKCPFDQNNEHFRALRWEDNGEEFVIGYTPAFQAALD